MSISKIDNENNLFSIILNDLSKNIELSKQFNFEKSAQSVSSLVSMLSHEIKNPLAGIKGASQIIQKRVNFKGKDLNLIKLINNETERIKKLLNSLENFTDDRPIKKKSTNLNQVIRNSKDSIEAIFNNKKIIFIENYDPSLPNIYGNENQLTQLFLTTGLSDEEYLELIEDLNQLFDHNASNNNLSWALDLLDILATHPCPSDEGRLRLFSSVIEFSSRQIHRLNFLQTFRPPPIYL